MGFLEEYAKKRYKDRNPLAGPPSNSQMLIDSVAHLLTAILEFARRRKP